MEVASEGGPPTLQSDTSRERGRVAKASPREFRVSEHIYVPKHEVLSREEAEELFRRYNATPEQFPYILSSDPALKGLGAKPGDVIKITRRSGTAGQSVYYRVVVEG
jgi:DNA-directed RNA polymerase subunit H